MEIAYSYRGFVVVHLPALQTWTIEYLDIFEVFYSEQEMKNFVDELLGWVGGWNL